MPALTAYLLFFSTFITGYFCASCDGSLFYALFSGDQDYSYTTEKILQIDSTSGNVTKVYNTTLNTSEYSAFLGSAVHPTTGDVYVVLLHARGYSDEGYPRALARLSIPDGNVEVIGTLGAATDYLGIADLAFDCDGTLYAISGVKKEVSAQYANTSSSIFIVDIDTADTQFIFSRRNESISENAGEAIAFNYDDGSFYRFSGREGWRLFESITIEMNMTDNSYIVDWTHIDIIDVNDTLLDVKIMAFEYIGEDIFVGFSRSRQLFSITMDGYILDSMEIGTNFDFDGTFLEYKIPRAIIATDGVENNICYRLCPTQEPTSNPTTIPTGDPTRDPTGFPTTIPTGNPTEVAEAYVFNTKISVFFIICSLTLFF